jgi:hypothetical protein
MAAVKRSELVLFLVISLVIAIVIGFAIASHHAHQSTAPISGAVVVSTQMTVPPQR